MRGVWVQRARVEYAFRYNLSDVSMNRDRGVVDAWQANELPPCCPTNHGM